MKAQEIFDRLNNMELSEVARLTVATSDQYGVELFANCKTAEDVEALVAEIVKEEGV